MKVAGSVSASSLDVNTWIRNGIRGNEFEFCSTIWWIWRNRNNTIFNTADLWSPLKVKFLYVSLTKELNILYNWQPASTPTSLLVDWVLPHGVVNKINCDASMVDDKFISGFGCVIHDSKRNWVKECLAAQPCFNPDHNADSDLIVKIHDMLFWNWNAEIVLVQCAANVTAGWLAKRATSLNIEYAELLEPLY
ncbi:hypothetical protein PIB30_017061 [Stylosanthes scabra]|uniref:RNase H type-1 domain-containing protein n=1 Tax=Stylosanthes scabra TaxID=79078 RepID=A0ABU6S7Q1_9FABA|nr:hypothetical protein [Stylosanthes scabra]